LAIVAATAVSRGFADDQLAAADAALGFRIPDLTHWMMAHPQVQEAANRFYLLWAIQFTLVPTALVLLRQERRFQLLCIAWALQFVIGLPIYAAFPAEGSFAHFGLGNQSLPGMTPLFASHMGDTIRGIQSGAIRDITKAAGGLISMPSFHAAGAVLFMFATWHIPVVRYVLTVLNVVLIGTALTSGSHYLVDVIAGVILGGVCLVLARQIFRQLRGKAANSGSAA
jgi:membrane-associated phospholipid phosphatase